LSTSTYIIVTSFCERHITTTLLPSYTLFVSVYPHGGHAFICSHYFVTFLRAHQVLKFKNGKILYMNI